jgi:hypothetical protein
MGRANSLKCLLAVRVENQAAKHQCDVPWPQRIPIRFATHCSFLCALAHLLHLAAKLDAPGTSRVKILVVVNHQGQVLFFLGLEVFLQPISFFQPMNGLHAVLSLLAMSGPMEIVPR